MPVIVGPRETATQVQIASDADFHLAVRSTGAPFPAGAVLELRFPIGPQMVSWAGSIDPDDDQRMVWAVDELDVAAMLVIGKPKKIRVHYVHGETDLLWAIWQCQVI